MRSVVTAGIALVVIDLLPLTSENLKQRAYVDQSLMLPTLV
jgi:hypothetical protein